MDNLGMWSCFSIPIFVALTSTLKGRSRNVAVWIYLWGLDAVAAYLEWRDYQLRHAYSAIDGMSFPSISPLYHAWHLFVIVFTLVLPVVWYCRDRRQESALARVTWKRRCTSESQ